MKNYTLLFVVLCAALSAQPTIPVGNLYPVTGNSIIGNIGPAGRAEAIPIGSGLAFSGGALIATGGGGGGSGTVTSIPDGSTNGVTWTVATRTTTPTFTFTLGAITPTSIVASSTISGSNLSGTNTGDQNLWRNIVVSGQDTVIPVTTTSALTLVAGTNVTLATNNTTKSVTISASGGGSGNVTASGTLTSGNIIVGGGTTVISASNITVSGNDITIPGNATISGNTTFGNLTTGNLTVTGNITSTTVTDGQLFIGNNTGDRLQLATLTAGDNISITNGAGSITINATSGGGADRLANLTAAAISVTTSSALTIGRLNICNGSGSDITVTLPAVSGNAGRFIGIKITGANLVTVDANGSETIDGATTRIMWGGEAAELECDGSTWHKVGGVSLPMFANLENTAGTTVGSGATTNIPMPTTISQSTTGMTSSSRINILRPGRYIIDAFWSGTNTGSAVGGMDVQMQICKNSTTVGMDSPSAAMVTASVGRVWTFAHVALTHTRTDLVAGDFITMSVLHETGVTLTSRTTSTICPHLNIMEVPSW